MKIAIIGTGIAGNVVAHHLYRKHDITLFEANSHVGGHTHTHAVTSNGRPYAVDTGFIVYNDWTYPNFIALLDELGVASQATSMSFAFRCEASGLEYCGSSLNRLFAQRRNLLRPAFYRMLRDILRFNHEAPLLLQPGAPALTLGDYLALHGYSGNFIDDYIVPMGAAIWSTDPQQMLSFPAISFVRFFTNHGLLSVSERPQWRVIQGGSKQYVDTLVAPFRHRIRLGTPVTAVKRCASHVTVQAAHHEAERLTPCSSPATATRRWRCSTRPPAANARCSAPLPTSRTKSFCTPIPGCCHGGGWRGGRGTTTAWTGSASGLR